MFFEKHVHCVVFVFIICSTIKMKRMKPLLRITQMNPDGSKRTKKVSIASYLGKTTPNNVQQSQQCVDETQMQDNIPSSGFQSDDSDGQGPSRYYFYRQKVVTCWTELREALLNTQIECAVPQSDKCVTCGDVTLKVIRCLMCGPHFQECVSCTLNTHQHRQFHFLEEWTVRQFFILKCLW